MRLAITDVNVNMTFQQYCEQETYDINESLNLDKAFGIDSQALAVSEPNKQSPEQIGLGADPNGLWTPYPWFHLMFKDLELEPGTRVCDVGAGIGRLGIYLRVFRPDLYYVGLELVGSRRRAAEKAGLNVLGWDVEKRGVPISDVYYFYNALPRPAYDKFISNLRELKHEGHKFLVLSIYDPYNGLTEALRPVKYIPVVYPVRHEFVVYTSETP